MNKIIVFLLASLLVGSVCAGQRLMDIQSGFPCDGIPQVEKSLGSVELATQDTNGISKYTGTQGGVEAIVVYRCDQGRLTEQEIIFTTTSQSKAYQIANEQRKELAKNLGEPIHDGLNLGVWKKMVFGFLGADLDYLTSVVVWGRAKDAREIEIVQEDATMRYLRFLDENPALVERLPQYHIASHLGITPTQLSRIRKNL